MDDGCGSTLLCGACTRPGETCGGSGTPNVCGGLPPPPTPPAGMTALCTPATRDVACHDQDCGSVPDGCGSTLDCGNCAAPAVCDTGHTSVYPNNVCRVTGDPTERCTPITGGSGLSRCATSTASYCRELFGRIQPCPGSGPTCAPLADHPEITRCVEGTVGWCQTTGTTARVNCPTTPSATASTPTPPAGTMNVALRADNGDLLLFRGGSDGHWAWVVGDRKIYQSYRIPMQLSGPPTLLFQPESKGAPAGSGGRIHIFGRSDPDNRLAYRWCDINEFRGTSNNCQGPGPLAFSVTNVISAVLLGDGTILGFYRGNDAQIAYFKGPGGFGGFREGTRIMDLLRSSSETGNCGGISDSPSAVLKPATSTDPEELDVFARDGDWFHGHVIRAYLPNLQAFLAHPETVDNRWRCEVFNGGNGGTDTGPAGIGTAPVAIFNGRTHQVDILGTEFGGQNRPILWMSGVDRTSGRMYLQPSQILSTHTLSYPSYQPLGVAVQQYDTPDRMLHLFYRTNSHRLAHAYLMGDGRIGYEILLDNITNNSPQAMADPNNHLHLFAVEETSGRLIHYFHAADDDRTLWRGPDIFAEVGIATTDNSPAVIFSSDVFHSDH